MRLFAVLALLVCLPAAAQEKPVVTIEGKAFTKAELETFVQALPGPVSQNFANNKKQFLEALGLMMKMAKIAEQEGLDKKSPHDARLLYQRLQYLATAEINEKDNSASINTEDLQKYYDAHKSEFGQAKTKVLYVAFNNNPMPSGDPKAKKPLNEAQAKEKAAALLKQARGGADFEKLVRENSDDADSRSKNGDFPPFRQSDQALPAPLKAAIFALKPGEFSDVIAQPNGFYIFRMESVEPPEFEKMRDEVYNKVRREKLDQWVDSVRKSVSIQFNDEQYFAGAGAQVDAALSGLPEFTGAPIRLSWRRGIRVREGRISQSGADVHAAAFLRERRLVLDSDLKLDPCELRRIVVHELFHFAWVRLGNQRRREWEAVLRNEVAAGAGGELGWSAEWRKAALSAQRAAVRDRRWREYACEAFCDTAAFLFALKDHPEFTLAPRFRKLRRNWFGGLLRNIVRL